MIYDLSVMIYDLSVMIYDLSAMCIFSTPGHLHNPNEESDKQYKDDSVVAMNLKLPNLA